MHTWQIDALDPRGGIAFASWRDYSLADEISELREAPCVTIAAPYFRPEPVASRALARSAPRGSFQIGLFAGEGEVSFTSLNAVAEFTRRAYISSAGRDDIEGSSTPVPPEPTGGGPALPALPLDFLDLFTRLEQERFEPEAVPELDPGLLSIDIRMLLNSFAELSHLALEGPVSGVPFRWTDSEDEDKARPAIGVVTKAENILGWAALMLVHEMLSRLPAARSAEERLRWQEAARALGHAIARLGLWDWLFGMPGFWTLASWVDAMRGSPGWPIDGELARIETFQNVDEAVRTRTCMWLLFGAAPAIDHTDWLDWIEHLWETRGDGKDDRFNIGPLGQTIMSTDPLHMLKLTPFPGQLSYLVSDDVRPDATLYHLLAGATATPARLLAGGGDIDSSAAIALTLFGACVMVLEDTDTQVSFGSFGNWGTSFSDLQAERLGALMNRAWDWLSGSLPRLAFPQAIEQMIIEAASLRYGDGRAEGDVATQPIHPLSPLDGGIAEELPREEQRAAAVAFSAA